MSARGTAAALALAVALTPARLGASDPEPGRGRTLRSLPSSTTLRTAPPVLRLAWLDVTGVAEGADWIARTEARDILEKAGFDVAWRRGSDGEESRPGEIRIILVDRLMVDRVSRRPVLGATPVGFHEHPFLWIHVPSVRATLGLPLRAPSHTLKARARRNLGVALGRVVAHEIVHALAPSVPHGRELMAETLTLTQLTRANLRVDASAILAIHEGLQGRPGGLPAGRGVLAAAGEGEVGEDPAGPRARPE
jgi:hypothetical protein